MLRNEIPENLRRQMLWERQQVEGPLNRTRPSRDNELKPLATTPNMVQLRPKGSTNQERLEGSGDSERRGEETEEDMAEKWRKAIARNRNWADTYHTSGW
jgi:hypothetical protein